MKEIENEEQACGCGCGLVPCQICGGEHYVGRKCAGDRRLAERREGMEAKNFVHGHEMSSPYRVIYQFKDFGWRFDRRYGADRRKG